MHPVWPLESGINLIAITKDAVKCLFNICFVLGKINLHSVSFCEGISHGDCFSRETYNALTNWLTDARTLASPNIVIVLVGNKKDLEAEREVTFLEASRFAIENGECSTLMGGLLLLLLKSL